MMDKRTQAEIQKITYQVAMECGMETAITETPDKLQEETKEMAEYILKKTGLSTGNSWTYEENEKLAKQMRDILEQKTRMNTTIDATKQKEYEARLSAKIAKAIKDGRIPDPKKDPFIQKQNQRLG